MKKILGAFTVALGVFATLPAFAGSVMVEDVWARASAGMARAGAAFMTIKNHGDADKLIDAKSGVSEKTELHNHIMDNGVMKMRQVEGGIDVPASGEVMLKPGSYHVMFMGLNAPFKEGDSFPLTLVFEKAGEVNVTVTVKKVGSMGAGDMKPMQNMKH